MEFTPYDILRTEGKSAIWLETYADLHTAKYRIKEIASFWPGRYEVVEHHSQRVVASAASSSHLSLSFPRMREYAQTSFLSTYEWLLGPARLVFGLATCTRMQKYTRDWYRASIVWLRSPATSANAYRLR